MLFFFVIRNHMIKIYKILISNCDVIKQNEKEYFVWTLSESWSKLHSKICSISML